MSRYLPDFCFVALVAVYIAVCYAAPSVWWVFLGYACGWGTQMCLEWKRDRALASSMTVTEEA